MRGFNMIENSYGYNLARTLSYAPCGPSFAKGRVGLAPNVHCRTPTPGDNSPGLVFASMAFHTIIEIGTRRIADKVTALTHYWQLPLTVFEARETIREIQAHRIADNALRSHRQLQLLAFQARYTAGKVTELRYR